ncbi:hypothetical protein V5O48_012910 [Marasmius crinis-equi]|uniref:Uncharacterized protein n=1 Tax=Marasmius crinis-equi TaxID=585013 RepID=A0ABR3F1Q3_9AGAR
MAYLSIALCAATLCVIALLGIHPVSRPKLDRVSFRMLIYALSGTLLLVFANGPGMCRLVGPVVVFAIQLSAFLFFCIGLNLQLVMIHGVDGRKAEKFYVGGSLSMAMVLGVLSFASKQWRYNTDLKLCQNRGSDPVKDLLWQVWNQQLWIFLTMIGEIIVFYSVLAYMYRLEVFDRSRQRSSSQVDGCPELSASRQYPRPRGPAQYRNMILRIALYPLSSFTTLGLVSVGHMWLAARGLKSRTDLKIHIAARIVYVSRGTVYSLVTFMDPALSRAFKSLYQHYRPKKPQTRATDDSLRSGATISRNFRASEYQGLELVELNHLHRDATVFTPKPDFDDSRSNVTLPSRPIPVAKLPSIRRQPQQGYPMMEIDHTPFPRVDGNVEYSNLEERL